jgi:cephalosporin-C deacetylase-like acetyl esterase
MFKKTVIRFPAEGGIELSAWLFVPDHQAARLPAITMAHGYTGTKHSRHRTDSRSLRGSRVRGAAASAYESRAQACSDVR